MSSFITASSASGLSATAAPTQAARPRTQWLAEKEHCTRRAWVRAKKMFQEGAAVAQRRCARCENRQQDCFMSTVVHRGELASVCIYCTGVAKSGCNALLQPSSNLPPSPNLEDESPSDIDNEANVNIGGDELLVGQELLKLAGQGDAAIVDAAMMDAGRSLLQISRGHGQA